MLEERKIKILCVEDEQEIRENISEILREEGFEVLEAENGRSGFDSFIQNKPDLVISDIMMPDVDGYGLLKMIRESKTLRNNNVPFIFLTALGQKDNVLKGVNLSANDYLIKPIDFELMIAKVKEKTSNALKLQSEFKRNISNIKDQVAVVLPSELFTYLEVITQTSKALKDEPYGPVPNNKYLVDFDTIYINAVKLKASITNALDKEVIDNRLNSDEEVFSIVEFIDGFVTSFPEKFRARIDFEHPYDSESLPKLKVDKLVIMEALKKILAGLLRVDNESKVTFTVMIDRFDQMIVIFYLKAKTVDLSNYIDENQVAKILDQQSCRFEIIDGREGNAVLIIPKHRLINV